MVWKESNSAAGRVIKNGGGLEWIPFGFTPKTKNATHLLRFGWATGERGSSADITVDGL